MSSIVALRKILILSSRFVSKNVSVAFMKYGIPAVKIVPLNH